MIESSLNRLTVAIETAFDPKPTPLENQEVPNVSTINENATRSFENHFEPKEVEKMLSKFISRAVLTQMRLERPSKTFTAEIHAGIA